MNELADKLEELTVIKRNGKKVNFDGSKIALAIKKGFDSVEVDTDEDEKERKYTSKDIQKVYQAVLKKIDKDAAEKNNKFIKKYLFICQKKSYNKKKKSKNGGNARCACANRHSLQN